MLLPSALKPESLTTSGSSPNSKVARVALTMNIAWHKMDTITTNNEQNVADVDARCTEVLSR